MSPTGEVPGVGVRYVKRQKWRCTKNARRERDRHTSIGEEEHGNRGLLEREQETDIRVKGGEDDIPRTNGGVIVNFGKDGIDEGVEFHGIGIHFLLLGFVEHGVLYGRLRQIVLEQITGISAYSSQY